MRTFTNNPLERFMMQPPHAEKVEPRLIPAPKGHFCYGCGRFGMACIRPCYRDRRQKDEPQNEL